MGDTGSLGIGAAIAVFALLENVDLLLPLIGGLYVLETLSVIVQVTSYRAFGGGCSGWHRSTTTSSCSVGRRRR